MKVSELLEWPGDKFDPKGPDVIQDDRSKRWYINMHELSDPGK